MKYLYVFKECEPRLQQGQNSKSNNMKTLNKELIKKLRNGRAILEHAGTVEELQEISKAAFPEGPVPTGRAKFYKKHRVFDWIDESKYPQLPIHPTSDFFIDEEQSVDIEEDLKWGEPVMVRDSENEEWRGDYFYVGRNPKRPSNHIVVTENDGLPVCWKFCKRQLPKPRFSRAEYAQRLGISVNQIGDIELVD